MRRSSAPWSHGFRWRFVRQRSAGGREISDPDLFGSGLVIVITGMGPKCTGSKGHLPANPVALEREAHAEQWQDYVEPVRKAVAAVARRYRLDSYDAEELHSELWVKLLADDGRRLRGFRGDASLKSYLVSIGRNLVLDRRNKEWGKWRPSEAARRLGPDAIALDKLIRRDGLSADEAVATLCRAGAADLRGLRSVAETFTRPPGRRLVCLETIGDVPSPAEASASTSNAFDHAHQMMRVKRALRLSLQALTPDDRNLIGWRFGHAMTVSQISADLGSDAPPLYRRLSKVLRALRMALVAHGVDISTVRLLLEHHDTDFDVNLAACFRPGSRLPELAQEAS
jgi:RNA polymerase sigma factor (sigma-70 family)